MNDDNPLAQLHRATIAELLRRIQAGEAKPADLAVAAKILRDNNITSIPEANSDLSKLLNALPNFESETSDL